MAYKNANIILITIINRISYIKKEIQTFNQIFQLF